MREQRLTPSARAFFDALDETDRVSARALDAARVLFDMLPHATEHAELAGVVQDLLNEVYGVRLPLSQCEQIVTILAGGTPDGLHGAGP
ncbi:hypothetical protein ACIGEP_01660 [Microbacterium sp. NPDC077663]|uniref:hypothetical protein n=1 Tax=Microbacterium sp. NPDC077663 TaxID=3364189 RepID=UPI0037CC5015